MVEEGSPAPDFEATTDTGERVKLSDFRGKAVVLYFYPKDDTPGCTLQACDFRDTILEFEQRGAVVLGVSPDDAASHVRFKEKYELPFILLADPDHAVAEQYGVWGEKNYAGRKYMGISRTTFVIDADGNMVKVMHNVKPDGHAQKVLDALAVSEEQRQAEGHDPSVSRRRFLALGAVPLAGLVHVEDALASPASPPPTVYDVTAYGAQGDGTADDANAIQAAVDAANARGGGTIVFPAGTFRVTRGITIYSDIVFRGAGTGVTIDQEVERRRALSDPPQSRLRPARDRGRDQQLVAPEHHARREQGGRPSRPRPAGLRVRVQPLQRLDRELRRAWRVVRILEQPGKWRAARGDARERESSRLRPGRRLLERPTRFPVGQHCRLPLRAAR